LRSREWYSGRGSELPWRFGVLQVEFIVFDGPGRDGLPGESGVDADGQAVADGTRRPLSPTSKGEFAEVLLANFFRR